jgi:hypothetical protein
VEANIVDIATVGGSVAAIAIPSIWFNHKLVTVWTTQVQETCTEQLKRRARLSTLVGPLVAGESS